MLAIGSLVSVLFVGIGLYITNEANREQQRLTEQGQITERFTAAVEQLGQPGLEKVDVRLGAIYALERIMRDSAVDHPAVVQLLAAFVRVHAPAPNLSPSPPSQLAKPPTPPSPPVDIQAALTVLGRRESNRDRSGDGIDLSHTSLRGIDLNGASLRGVDLSGADLSHADLSGADLSAAGLGRANLIGSDLGGTNLNTAFLLNADLRYADLASAELWGAELTGAKLADADLRNADFGEANGVTTESVRFACIGFGTTLAPGVVSPPDQESKAHCRPQEWKLLPPRFSERKAAADNVRWGLDDAPLRWWRGAGGP
ncbi:pentapeptide repeat-containing protein [Micromonospora chalcea]|uniref:pentapeptide repeat-containing protein n=1 Tax=Micromonospora chalcea TaxID=1874 RepID=UPI003D72246F